MEEGSPVDFITRACTQLMSGIENNLGYVHILHAASYPAVPSFFCLLEEIRFSYWE